MSPRLVLLNVLLLAVAVFFGLELMGELSGPRPLPGQPVARAPQASPPAAPAPPGAPPRPDPRGQYAVIATRSLFSPSRTDVVATGSGAPGQAATPRPILHGVVLDDARSRAYLEEPATKRVFGYAVGDSVGGGKLETIRADRVVIARQEGPVEVMLRDPSKPAPPAVTVGAQPGAGGALPAAGTPFPTIRPRVGASPTPGAQGVLPGALPAPSAQPMTAPPRALQSIPSDFLRRPAVPPPDAADR